MAIQTRLLFSGGTPPNDAGCTCTYQDTSGQLQTVSFYNHTSKPWAGTVTVESPHQVFGGTLAAGATAGPFNVQSLNIIGSDANEGWLPPGITLRGGPV